MTDFGALLATLGTNKVEYIVVGGAAAIAHGSARLTQDLDIVYHRTPDNLDRLVASLSGHHPYLRGAPFLWDSAALQRGLNFTLITSLRESFGTSCLCLSLARLIRTKIAAGRPKDLEALAELEAIKEERG